MSAFVHLSDAQSKIFEARHRRRFCVVVAGRRFGKTTLGLTRLIMAACEKPDAILYFVANTYGQAKNAAWKPLKRMCPEGVISQINESELFVEFVNGSRIVLKGADNPHTLRGVGLDGLVLDEYADMKPETWTEVLRPALSDRMGWALFIGTPRSYNHFYDLYLEAKNPEHDDWYAWQFTTAEGGVCPADEIESARRTLDTRTFRQEYEASFESMSGRVYYAFDHNEGANLDSTIKHIDKMGGTPLLFGSDFNVANLCACFGYRVGDDLHVFDEIELTNSNTFELAEEINRKFGTRPLTADEAAVRDRSAHIEGAITSRRRHIRACPDPSCDSRKTSAKAGVTDLTILRDAGFEINKLHVAPALKDKFNTVNSMLKTADGSYRIKIHPRCVKLIKALQGQAYKPGTNIPEYVPGVTDMCDALAYLVMSEFGVMARSSVSVLRINL